MSFSSYNQVENKQSNTSNIALSNDSVSSNQDCNNKEFTYLNAIAKYNQPIHLPGTALYLADSNKVSLNSFFVYYLGLPEKLSEKWIDISELTEALGPRMSNIIFNQLNKINLPIECFDNEQCTLMRCPLGKTMSERLSLSCPALSTHITQGGTNRVFFELLARKGAYKGTRFYCRAVGLFAYNKTKSKKELAGIYVTLSRVNNFVFDKIPKIVEERGYYDWRIFEDSLRHNKRYYQVFGYKRFDKRIPNTSIDKWVKVMIHEQDRNNFSTGIADFYHMHTNFIKKVEDNIEKGGESPSPCECNQNSNECLNSFESYEQFFRIRRSDNNFVWTKSVGVVVATDPKTNIPSRVIGANLNINKITDSFESLRNKVFTDILTGLKNRTYLMSHINEFMKYDCQPLSVIYSDITGLKLYNDYLNHSTGDKLLCIAADMLKSCTELEHEIIRVSGDEVIILLPECNDIALKKVEDSIQALLEKYNKKAPIRMPVLFSSGSATVDFRVLFDDPHEIEDDDFLKDLFYKTLSIADMRMHKQKEKNREKHYSLIRQYIEGTLNRKISIEDNRTIKNLSS